MIPWWGWSYEGTSVPSKAIGPCAFTTRIITRPLCVVPAIKSKAWWLITHNRLLYLCLESVLIKSASLGDELGLWGGWRCLGLVSWRLFGAFAQAKEGRVRMWFSSLGWSFLTGLPLGPEWVVSGSASSPLRISGCPWISGKSGFLYLVLRVRSLCLLVPLLFYVVSRVCLCGLADVMLWY